MIVLNKIIDTLFFNNIVRVYANRVYKFKTKRNEPHSSLVLVN